MAARWQFRLFLQGLGQFVGILLAAAACGLLVNELRPDGLALVEDGSLPFLAGQLDPNSTSELTISLDDAAEAFFSEAAVFLDARSPDRYRFGHILGARNLPLEDLEGHFSQVTADLKPDTVLIAYCDGEACNLSMELAVELLVRGFTEVRVLVNGWSLWKAAGLPVEEGAPGSGS